MNTQKIFVLAMRMKRENPGWRAGQCAFNALHELHPEFADEIRGTEADPFHDNSRIGEFWAKVIEKEI